MPAWMVTFSDVVTLLMTFFIVLVSMAALFDAAKRKVALVSVTGAFGTGTPSLDDLSTEGVQNAVEPGPLNDLKDAAKAKVHVVPETTKDVRFESNKFIKRYSLEANMLFSPGSPDITPEGRTLLAKLTPTLIQSKSAISLAGHTAAGVEEFGPGYLPKSGEKVDFSWQLSLARVMNVYRYFVAAGVDAQKLRLEAFGRFRPIVGAKSVQSGNANRRVEITMDVRVDNWDAAAAPSEILPKTEAPASGFSVQDFLFRFDLPGKK